MGVSLILQRIIDNLKTRSVLKRTGNLNNLLEAVR